MRRSILIAVAAFALAGPAQADCLDDLKAVLVKSHASGPYIVELTTADMTMTAEIVPPSAVHATTHIGGETQEMTVVDGKGWMRIGPAWETLPDTLAAAMMMDMASTVRILDEVGTAECLGPRTFEDKSYVAYEYGVTAKDAATASTLYVDPASNLPAVILATETAFGQAKNTRVEYRYDPGVTVSAPR